MLPIPRGWVGYTIFSACSKPLVFVVVCFFWPITCVMTAPFRDVFVLWESNVRHEALKTRHAYQTTPTRGLGPSTFRHHSVFSCFVFQFFVRFFRSSDDLFSTPSRRHCCLVIIMYPRFRFKFSELFVLLLLLLLLLFTFLAQATSAGRDKPA